MPYSGGKKYLWLRINLFETPRNVDMYIRLWIRSAVAPFTVNRFQTFIQMVDVSYGNVDMDLSYENSKMNEIVTIREQLGIVGWFIIDFKFVFRSINRFLP